MRKILLASTALIALGTVSAMAAPEIAITGSYEFGYNSDSGDGVPDDATTYSTESDINIAFSNVTDNGLTTTLNYGLDESGSADDLSASISGDFGKILFTSGVDDDAVAALDTDVTDSVSEEGAYTFDPAITVYNGGNKATAGDSISYTLPNFIEGLTVAIANSNTADDEATAYGLSYTTALGATSVTLTATSAAQEIGADKTSYSHFGTKIAAGDFTLRLSSNSADDEKASTDKKSTGIGVSYSVGNLTLGAQKVSAETGTTTEDYAQTAFGVDYIIAPGLSVQAASTSTDMNETNSVKRIRASISLSF